LIYDDGEPLESNWHRIQMNLLIDIVYQKMVQRGRSDFFVGGNMFIYFSFEQAKVIAANPPEGYRHFRGPDFFYVGGVDPKPERNAWVVWREEGRYPDVIIELLSASTSLVDKTTKKKLYERTFHTPEYFWYDPVGDELMGWRINGGRYKAIEANEKGWLRSEELGMWLGRWHGVRVGQEALWLRFYDYEGALAPTPAEAERERAEAERQRAEAERERAEAERQRAEAERERAEAERQRADAAEAELARLRTRLAELE